MKVVLNLDKLKTQIAQMDVLSQEQHWEVFYDDKVDSLYFAPKKIEKGYSLFSLTDEFSVFVDEKSNLGGIFIEYYKSNLTTHDKKFKPFKKVFTEDTKKQENQEKQILFTEVLKAELLSELISTKQHKLAIPV